MDIKDEIILRIIKIMDGMDIKKNNNDNKIDFYVKYLTEHTTMSKSKLDKIFSLGTNRKLTFKNVEEILNATGTPVEQIITFIKKDEERK